MRLIVPILVLAMATAAWGATATFEPNRDTALSNYAGAGSTPPLDGEMLIGSGASTATRFAKMLYNETYLCDFDTAAINTWITANPLPADQYYSVSWNVKLNGGWGVQTPAGGNTYNESFATPQSLNIRYDWVEGDQVRGLSGWNSDQGVARDYLNWTFGTASATAMYSQCYNYFDPTSTGSPDLGRKLDEAKSVMWTTEAGIMCDSTRYGNFWASSQISRYTNSVNITGTYGDNGSYRGVVLDPILVQDLLNNPMNRGLRCVGDGVGAENISIYTRESTTANRPYIMLTPTTLVKRQMRASVELQYTNNMQLGFDLAGVAVTPTEKAVLDSAPTDDYTMDLGGGNFYCQDLIMQGGRWVLADPAGVAQIRFGRQLVFNSSNATPSVIDRQIITPGALIVQSGQLNITNANGAQNAIVGTMDVQGGVLELQNQNQLWMTHDLHVASGAQLNVITGQILNNGYQTMNLSGLGTIKVGSVGGGQWVMKDINVNPGEVSQTGTLRVQGSVLFQTSTWTSLNSPGAPVIPVNAKLNVRVNSNSAYDTLETTMSVSGLDQLDIAVKDLPVPGVSFSPTNVSVPIIRASSLTGTTTSLVAAGTASWAKYWKLNAATNLVAGSTTLSLTLTAGTWTARPGDADLSGTVNGLDFNILSGKWGKSAASWSNADFNFDGTVNGVDFAALAANWGKSWTGSAGGADVAAVPEPVTMTLLGIGGVAVLLRRRR